MLQAPATDVDVALPPNERWLLVINNDHRDHRDQDDSQTYDVISL